MRFPGDALPANAPLRWSDWTGPSESIVFSGAATVASAPLRWADWTAVPVVAHKTMHVHAEAPVAAPVKRPTPLPAVSAPVARPVPAQSQQTASLQDHAELLGLGALSQSMAASSASLADTHALFLRTQQDHLDRLQVIQAHLDQVSRALFG